MCIAYTTFVIPRLRFRRNGDSGSRLAQSTVLTDSANSVALIARLSVKLKRIDQVKLRVLI